MNENWVISQVHKVYNTQNTKQPKEREKKLEYKFN